MAKTVGVEILPATVEELDDLTLILTLTLTLTLTLPWRKSMTSPHMISSKQENRASHHVPEEETKTPTKRLRYTDPYIRTVYGTYS